MPTNKPQFNVYLDPAVAAEIDQHAKHEGYKKGKLVENMWRFFNLRDLAQLHRKLAEKLASGLVERERGQIIEIWQLLDKHVRNMG